MAKSKPEEGPSCTGCVHWSEGTESSDEVRWGFCRRYPPIPVATGDEDEPVQCVQAWVTLPHVCGEHKQRTN